MFDTLWRKFRKQNLYPPPRSEQSVNRSVPTSKSSKTTNLGKWFPSFQDMCVIQPEVGEFKRLGNHTKRKVPPGRVSTTKDATSYEVQARVGFQVSVVLKYNPV